MQIHGKTHPSLRKQRKEANKNMTERRYEVENNFELRSGKKVTQQKWKSFFQNSQWEDWNLTKMLVRSFNSPIDIYFWIVSGAKKNSSLTKCNRHLLFIIDDRKSISANRWRATMSKVYSRFIKMTSIDTFDAILLLENQSTNEEMICCLCNYCRCRRFNK